MRAECFNVNRKLTGSICKEVVLSLDWTIIGWWWQWGYDKFVSGDWIHPVNIDCGGNVGRVTVAIRM